MADRMAGEAEAGSARRSPCPVAGALDLIGDRWTLLLIRDMVAGKRRFSDFLASPEQIPTNILASRLKRLERAGLVERTPYSAHPPRTDYHLTPAGQDLVPVVSALTQWGLKHIPGTRVGIGPGAAAPQ
jgi:DNA-binding HxlR family transcriptional regulator